MGIKAVHPPLSSSSAQLCLAPPQMLSRKRMDCGGEAEVEHLGARLANGSSGEQQAALSLSG